jgi:sigma-B regulation protein RsbU (phosphoserine phosphatase)
VTSVYGVLEPSEGRFIYANCGHNPPILFGAEGGTEKFEIGGPLLGVLEDVIYNAFEVTLAPGDLLLMYTDGVIEIKNSDGAEFGIDRLEALVRHSLDMPVPEIMNKIIQATQEFSGSERYHDDFTLVLIRREQQVS